MYFIIYTILLSYASNLNQQTPCPGTLDVNCTQYCFVEKEKADFCFNSSGTLHKQEDVNKMALTILKSGISVDEIRNLVGKNKDFSQVIKLVTRQAQPRACEYISKEVAALEKQLGYAQKDFSRLSCSPNNSSQNTRAIKQ